MAFKLYTFSSWFHCNHWVKVCYLYFLVRVSLINVGSRFYKKFVFQLPWAIILILFVGSQSVSIEVCIIWYQSTGSKISFLFLYLLFPIIILSCSFCVLIFFMCTRLKSYTKLQREKKNFRKEIENRKIIIIIILSVVSILSNQNIIFFCPLPLI